MKTRKALLILSSVVAASSVFADKVKLENTPASVQQVVRSKAGSHEIEDIDHENRNGQMVYEVSWKNNAGVQQELLLSENGQILRDVQGDPANYQAAGNEQSSDNLGANWQPQFGTASANVPVTGAHKVAIYDVPRPVQRTINYVANGSKIEQIQSGQYNGRTMYTTTFKRNGDTINLQTLDDGTIFTRTPGVAATTSTAKASTKRHSFFDRAADLLTGANTPQAAGAAGMSISEAPQAVQQTFNQNAKGAPLQNLQRSAWNGRTMYEASFQQNGQNMKMQVLDDGSILSMGQDTSAVGGPGSSQSGSGRGY